MTEANQDPDEPDGVWKRRVLQPAEGVLRVHKVRQPGPGRKLRASRPDRERAPGDEQHHHGGGDVHDAQRFAARFGNALDVLPPEIAGHQNREDRSRFVHRKDDLGARVREQSVQQARQIETCRDAADRTRQDVVEHERGYRDLGERRAHRFLDDAIYAAADEHTAALDVDRSDGVGEHHDGQDEPRRRFANEVFGDGARVERGRAHVVQHDGGRPPERDERQHRGRGDEHTRRPGRDWLRCDGGARFDCGGGREGRFRHTAP